MEFQNWQEKMLLQRYCKKYFCLRVSGLYGLKGTAAKKFPNYIEMMIYLGNKAVEKGESLPSAQDRVTIFTSTIEVAKAVEQLIQTDQYGLYHAACDGYPRRADFSRTLFQFLNMDVEVIGVNSDYFNPTYAQPKFSAMQDIKLNRLDIKLAHWKDALEMYLGKRKTTYKSV